MAEGVSAHIKAPRFLSVHSSRVAVDRDMPQPLTMEDMEAAGALFTTPPDVRITSTDTERKRERALLEFWKQHLGVDLS